MSWIVRSSDNYHFVVLGLSKENRRELIATCAGDNGLANAEYICSLEAKAAKCDALAEKVASLVVATEKMMFEYITLKILEARSDWYYSDRDQIVVNVKETLEKAK